MPYEKSPMLRPCLPWIALALLGVTACSRVVVVGEPPGDGDAGAAETDAGPGQTDAGLPPLSDFRQGEFPLDDERIPVVARGGAPTVAFDGDRYLVVYGRRAVRVEPDGTVLDRPAIVLPTLAAVGPPQVAARPGRFLVAYEEEGYAFDENTIVGVRIRSDNGEVLDPEPKQLLTGGDLAGLTRVSNSHFALAAGGDGYVLVAEREEREGLVLAYLDEQVKRTAVLVSPTEGSAVAPSLAWDGTSLLVAWEQRPEPDSGEPTELRAAAFGPTPPEEWPRSVALTTSPDRHLYATPSVAGIDGTFVVVWDHPRLSDSVLDRLMARRVSGADAEPLDEEPLVLATPWREAAHVHARAEGFVVVSHRSNEEAWLTVPLDGAPASFEFLDRAAQAFDRARGAWDEARSLVVWREIHQGHVRGAFLGPDGAFDHAPGILSFEPNRQEAPSVATNGDVILPTWRDNRTEPSSRAAVRVDPHSGEVLDAPARLFDFGGLRMASAGSGFLLAGSRDGHAAALPIDAKGEPEPIIDVDPLGTFKVRTPHVASNDELYLVAWSGEASSDTGLVQSLHAVRIDARTLEVLDDPPIEVAVDTLVEMHVAAEDESFLVASTGAENVTRAVRIDADGTTGTVRTVAEEGVASSLAYGDDRYLLALSRQDPETGVDFVGIPLDHDGGRRAEGSHPLVVAPGNQSDAQLLFDGVGFIVSWTERVGERFVGPSETVPISVLRAARVGPEGRLAGDPVELYEHEGRCRQAATAIDRGLSFFAYSCGGRVYGRFVGFDKGWVL